MSEARVPVRRMRPLLGTFVELGAYGALLPATRAIDRAFEKMGRVHDWLSFQQPESLLSRLNAQPHHWHLLPPLVIRVLRLARSMTLQSDGLFNCTLAGTLIADGILPDHGGHCLPIGNGFDIEVDGFSARLRRPVRITLDGIAKGFAVDLAVASLKRHGIAAGWVNAGGDLRCFGAHTLPVKQRNANGNLIELGILQNAALASSQTGNHPDLPARVYNPQGILANQGNAHVFSVRARFAWRADALTKVAANTCASERSARVAALGGTFITCKTT